MSIRYSYSAPRSQEDRGKKTLEPISTEVSSSSQYVSPLLSASSAPKVANGGPLRRIRKPHDHDVLCGRGGGINSHQGNIAFRNWVRERKEAYNLAHTKAAKTNVSREILDRVAGRKPPGRFLQREEIEKGPGIKSSQFWMEIDDIKAMAKTSQALREGAPAIRAKAKGSDEKSENRKSSKKMSPSQTQAKSKSPGSIKMEQRTRPRPDQETDQTQRKHRRQKLNPQEEDQRSSNRTLNFSDQNYVIDYDEVNDKINGFDVNMTEEEQMEKIALSSIPILQQLPIVPTASQANVNVQNIIPDDKDVDSNNRTLDNTPNLLPVPDPSDPPMLHAFPLPPTILSSEPLSPVFATFRSFAGRPFPEKPPDQNLFPGAPSESSKTLVRSHSIALSDLPDPDLFDKSYSHQESILNEDSAAFRDPFQNEEEDYLNGFLEGNPNFSAARICQGTKNVSPSPLLHNRSLSRVLTHSMPTARSTSMSLLVGNNENNTAFMKVNSLENKKSVCFCFCDGHDGVSKELCPCTHLANSLLTGELRL